MTSKGPKKVLEDSEEEQSDTTSPMTVELDEIPNCWYEWFWDANAGVIEQTPTCYLFLSPQTPYKIIEGKEMETFQLSIEYPLLDIQREAIIERLGWNPTQMAKAFPTRTKRITVAYEGKSLLSANNISNSKSIHIYEIKFTDHPKKKEWKDQEVWWEPTKKQEKESVFETNK